MNARTTLVPWMIRCLPLPLTALFVILLSSCQSRLDHPIDMAGERAAMTDAVTLNSWRVKLFWTTETESNSFGFYIHRADTADGTARIINLDEPLHGAGTTSTPQEYSFYDLDVGENQTYYYKLEQVDLDGTREFIVGHPDPVPAPTKPISENELEEIRTHGTMFRKEHG